MPSTEPRPAEAGQRPSAARDGGPASASAAAVTDGAYAAIRRPRRRALRWLAGLTCAGMLLVLVMGAAVTNTGSAEGCGRSWPLCNGQFVPEFTVATAIEYSHRAVTGLESLLVLALTAAMLALWRRQREVVVLVALMVGTLVLQAGLGAGAVLWPQSPLMLATHFGVSLVAFASTYLGAIVVWERTRGGGSAPMAASPSASPTARSWQDAAPSVSLAQPAALSQAPGVSPAFRRLTPGVVVYVLVVVYLGAYVRHADVSLACPDWPLCNGLVVPPLGGPTGVVFAHRLAALGALVLLGVVAVRARAVRLAATPAVHAFALGILQALSGALVVATHLGLFGTLLHAAVMGLLGAVLSHVLLLTVRAAKRNDSVPDVFSLSDAAARGLQPAPAASHPHASLASGISAATPAASTPGNPAAAGRSAVADDERG